MKYVTKMGDTWSSIAYTHYGNEYLFPLLLQANPKYQDYLVLPANVEIDVPTAAEQDTSPQPSWMSDAL